MKKLKLLLAFCALLLGWSNASAQKDVTSQYITNATLSNGLTGWTVNNFNNPVRGNNTTGYASECWAGNPLSKTSYSMTQTINLPAGNYQLVNYSFYRFSWGAADNPNKSLAKLKAGAQEVDIKTLGGITAAGYANSQAEGANCFDSKMYRNTVDFTVAADNTPVEIGIYGTHDAVASWVIAGMFELINLDEPATMDAPFDVTGYITNPGFEYRDLTGWTQSSNGYLGTQSNNQGFKVGGWYAEKWQKSGALPEGSATQTLTSLPAGYYKLTANLGGNGTYIDLNGKTASWTADKDYTVGYVLSENEDLTITFGKTAEGTANWIHFDNFRLQFCGDVAEALNTLIAKKTTYNGVIPSAAYSALLTAVNAYDKVYSDIDELLAAMDAVQDLYNEADLLKAPFASFLSLKAAADALKAVENTNPEANSTLSDAISGQVTAVNAATTAAGINTATATLKTAMITYVGVADPTSGNRFDLTFMLTNPDLTGLPTWAPADGWASEEADGNSQVMVNDSKTVGDKKYFYEYWSNPAKASGKFALYNAVTLPAGTYTMSCYAFAEDQYTASTVDGVYFYANDTQGSCVTSTVLAEQAISFINDEEQEVKIGLKTLTGNTRNWMGIGYVELYKEYTDNTTYDIEVTSTNCTVATTVDGNPATSAKALKTVTLTVTPIDDYAVSSVSASYDDGESHAIDVANPSTNVYTFQMPAYEVSVSILCNVDKSALYTAIQNATGARKSANEGTGVFQIPAAAGTTFGEAITDAQGVYDNAEATVSQVSTAVTTLNTAKETYEATTLNAPDAEKRYNVSIVEAGKAWDGNAITFIAGGRNDQGNYGVKYFAPANVNLNQALKFTPVLGEPNTYKVSAIRVENGSEQYLTTGSTYSGGNNDQIRTTDDLSKAMWIKIEATSTANQFQLRNMTANKIIANNNNNDMYTTGNANFTLAEASQATVTVSAKAGKYGTIIFPFTPDVSEGFDDIAFYSCNSVDGESVKIDPITGAPQANTPYIIKNTNGENFSKVLSGWGTAAADSYEDNGLTGIYTDASIPEGSYVLQTQGGVQNFYLVDAEEPVTGVPYRAYFTASTGVKMFNIVDGRATGVEAPEVAEAEEEEGVIYNTSGQVVTKDYKGIVIKNGKKYYQK